ncbi:MAG: hypothetical protein NVS9B12_04450 [Vulcanimicrobiaceae bacterium]
MLKMVCYFFLAGVLIAGVAPGALAQTGPPPIVRPGPPMPPALPLEVHNRSGTFDPRAGGITVAGQGVAVADADSAHITLQLLTRNNQAELDPATLKAVGDALIRAGADPKSVVLPVYLVGPARSNSAAVAATVQHPTVEMLIAGMQSLSKAFEAMPNVLVQRAEVNVGRDDCSSLRSSSRRAAFLQARAQALDIARQSGVQLGKILAVQSFTDNAGFPAGTNPNACGSYYQLGPGNYPQFTSPADFLKVRVNSNLTVTYAIK